MLFLLVTAQRCQTLHVLKLSDICFDNDTVVINISSILKQTRPGAHQNSIILHSYKLNKKLCVVETIKQYLKRTECLRDGDKLLISTVKPHKSVSKQTLSRWIKLVMSKAGITDNFKPHSTRSASTSFAYIKGVPLTDIIRTAGWSNANTFAKYYNKPIISDNTNCVQAVVLS